MRSGGWLNAVAGGVQDVLDSREAGARIKDVNDHVHPGDRMFIRCEGGPCLSRLEYFPPQLEIAERGGIYVLIDEGQPPD